MSEGQMFFLGAPIVIVLLYIWVYLAIRLTHKYYFDKNVGKNEWVPFKATLITFFFMWLEVAIPYGIYLLVR